MGVFEIKQGERMGIQLFEHNQKAYDAAVCMMEAKGKAAVIHPTGTGKSFIAFKLAEEHPKANICWLAPSEHIYRNQMENVKRTLVQEETAYFKNIHFLSYSKLMKMSLSLPNEGTDKQDLEENMEELSPDYIVLDEFHRCGAAEWGKSVNKLLARFPDAKILGLSATNIRYLDSQRDMAQEIFEGNIASEMTLGEAIGRGILAAPKYVTALYSCGKDRWSVGEELKKLEQKVKAVGSVGNQGQAGNGSENEELLERLRRALEQAEGPDKVFFKHMHKKHGKYIVFCADKEHMDEMKEHVPEWFHLIDTAPHMYTAYYNNPETNRDFAEFQADESEHLKLLFCIDMLNEGVHVADIDGVILLRPTVSPIIYLQQIGRALSTGASKEPIIFDLVNNFESLTCIDYLEKEMDEAFSILPCTHGERGKWNERFQIIDEVRDCRKLFGQLQANLASTWEIYYQAARNYYQEMGNLRIPKNYVTSTGLNLGSWIHTQRKVYAGIMVGALTEEKIQRLNAIGMVWNARRDSWEEAYRELTAYYEKYGNVDVKARYCGDSGYPLGRWVSNLRASVKKKGIGNVLTEEQRKKLEALGMIWDKNSEKWEMYLRAAKEYRKNYGDLKVPIKYVTDDGVPLGSWLQTIRHGASNEKSRAETLSAGQIEQLNALGMEWEKERLTLWNMKFELAREYYEQHGNLDVPVAYCVEGVKLGRWISNIRFKRRNPESSGMVLDEERIRQLDSIGMKWK